MDPTPQQKQRVATLKQRYGNRAVKAYQRRKTDGIVRVELACQAGTWQMLINETGDVVSNSLQTTMFIEGVDVTTTRPAALPRNAQDDNDT